MQNSTPKEHLLLRTTCIPQREYTQALAELYCLQGVGLWTADNGVSVGCKTGALPPRTPRPANSKAIPVTPAFPAGWTVLRGLQGQRSSTRQTHVYIISHPWSAVFLTCISTATLTDGQIHLTD